MMNKLKQKAIIQNIPIIEDESLFYIIDLIKTNNFKSILEIGTGIGYSAIMMAPFVESITTIERDEKRAIEALNNIKEFTLFNKIVLFHADALEAEIEGSFDLIFIDGAKAQYKKFFTKYENLLSPNGAIICDNLNFHNLNINEINRNTKQLIRKLNEFKEYLKTNNNYATAFLDIGDGLSVSRRKK